MHRAGGLPCGECYGLAPPHLTHQMTAATLLQPSLFCHTPPHPHLAPPLRHTLTPPCPPQTHSYPPTHTPPHPPHTHSGPPPPPLPLAPCPCPLPLSELHLWLLPPRVLREGCRHQHAVRHPHGPLQPQRGGRLLLWRHHASQQGPAHRAVQDQCRLQQPKGMPRPQAPRAACPSSQGCGAPRLAGGGSSFSTESNGSNGSLSTQSSASNQQRLVAGHLVMGMVAGHLVMG